MGTTTNLGLRYPDGTVGVPPDVVGDIRNLAQDVDGRVTTTPARMCHVYWNSSGDIPCAGNGFTSVQNNTAIYDPSNMRLGDNVSLQLPWTGRYSIWTRVAFTVSDTAAGYDLQLFNTTAGSLMAQKSISPVRAVYPNDIYTEEILNASTIVYPRIFRDSTINQWLQHYVDNSTRLQTVVRYLGPA